MKNVSKLDLVVGGIILIALSFAAGWWMKNPPPVQAGLCKSTPLRLTGFKYVRPLLICDTSPQRDFTELKPLNQSFTDIINQAKSDNKISTASVYFHDLKNDGRIDVNKDDKFNSASMGKVAVMIAVYRWTEPNPGRLEQKVVVNVPANLNSSQEVPPKDYAHIGQSYTVDDLVNLMIKYSDNNSLYALINLIGADTLNDVFKDLQAPFPTVVSQSMDVDFMTTRDFSYFFRVLYNDTYLTSDLSDKALDLLTQTDFASGLKSGVPSDVPASHKFGLKTLTNSGSVVERELSDCGVVYHPTHPYLLCVMTKGNGSIGDIESVIKDISTVAYKFQDNRQ